MVLDDGSELAYSIKKTIFLIALVLVFFYFFGSGKNSKSDSKNNLENQKTINELKDLNCQSKFSNSDKYYAICPNDNIIEISDTEFNLFQVDVKKSPTTYKKEQSEDSITFMGMLMFIVCILMLNVILFETRT